MQTLTDSVAELSAVEIGAPALILTVVLARLIFAPVIFAPRYARVWNMVRGAIVPLFDLLLRNRLGPSAPSVTNRATQDELVGVVETPPQRLALAVDDVRDVEIPLLAGYKQDWDDNAEVGTFVWYYGPCLTLTPLIRLLEYLPHVSPPSWLRSTPTPQWLRPFQVHVTVFRLTGGSYRVTAHREANPYRPDLWVDHLFKGDRFSASDGVDRTRRALDDAEIAVSDGGV